MLSRLDITFTGPETQVPTLTILEGEAFQVTLRALTADLAAATPTSARYRLDDMVQNNAVLDWTSLTPATAMNLIVTSAQNAMRNGMRKERRQLVLEASDADGPIRKAIYFDIVDLQGVS